MARSKTIARHRLAAFQRQRGLCFYCDDPMWLRNPGRFAAIHSLPLEAVECCKCTAEHLTARQDGGTNVAANIVAACRSCNQGRHAVPHAAPSAEEYRRQVQARGS